MKIVEGYNIEGIPVHDVPYGEVFVFAGSYYMRIKKENDIFQSPIVGEIVGEVAVNLANGEISCVPSTMLVPPIHARIRISGRSD